MEVVGIVLYNVSDYTGAILRGIYMYQQIFDQAATHVTVPKGVVANLCDLLPFGESEKGRVYIGRLEDVEAKKKGVRVGGDAEVRI